MSWLYWRKRENEPFERVEGEIGGQDQVDDQHPLPHTLHYRSQLDGEYQEVDDGNGLPVRVLGRTPVQDLIYVTEQIPVPIGLTVGALDANDAFGDPFTFTLPFQAGRIKTIRLVDRDYIVTAATIHIFSQPFKAAASDAAFTIAPTTDGPNWITSRTFGTPVDLVATKAVEVINADSDFFSPSRQLVCQLSTTGTPTPLLFPLVQLFIIPQVRLTPNGLLVL